MLEATEEEVGPVSTAGVVGFVGLGAMGNPMSRHLLEAGWTVYGVDTSEQAQERFRANGGLTVETPADLVGVVDVVVTSLPTAGAVREVIIGSSGLATRVEPGSSLTVIETSTLSLSDKLQVQELASDAGILLLDCPVSGTSAQAENKDVVAYLSGLGPERADSVHCVLRDMTRRAFDVGDFGSGTKMKLVANLLVGIHNMAAAEALLLADRSGLDLDVVLEAIGEGAGSSRMFEVRGPLMARRAYATEVTFRVEVFAKDFVAINELARSVTSPTPLLATTEMFYRAALAQGRGDEDTACVHGVLLDLIRPEQ